MIDLRRATEAEMVLALVRAEIESTEVGLHFRKCLTDNGLDGASIVDNGMAHDPDQHFIRTELLKAFRGYPDKLLFLGYPRDIEWRLVLVNISELVNFMYCKFYTLVEISGGSRRVGDGANNVARGTALHDFSERVNEIVSRIKRNEPLPDLIAVTDGRQIVLLDGHGRATAYAIANYTQPINVIIGTSPTITQWAFF